MNLRKTAGLLMAFGLVIGLVGTGVGASFVDQVKATENIEVGTFGCEITAGDGTIAPDGASIDHNAGTITSSAAGNAPFTFTVKNFGSIDQQLMVTASPATGSLSSKFTAMTLAPASPVALAAGASQVFTTGIEWTELDSSDLGDSGFIRWTVDCDETPAGPTVTPGYSDLTEAAGVRYRGESTGGEIYLGYPDLGTGIRVEADTTWPDGTYKVAFSFDGTGTISQTVDGGLPLAWSVASPSCAIGSWNTLDVLVVDRLTTGAITFENVMLDSFPLGDFGAFDVAGNPGFQNWTVSGFDFSNAFTVSGDLRVSGWTGSENNKLQLTVGCL